MRYSTIQVTNETKHRLKALKLTPKESYENIIIRLLDVRLDGRLIKYKISSIDKRFTLECSVDWVSDDGSLLFYDDEVGVYDAPPMRNISGWDFFVGEIYELDNLVNILAVLEEGDDIRANGLVLSRC